MRKVAVAAALLAATAVVVVAGWRRHLASQPIDVTLCFHAFVGGEPLVLNEVRYANPGGQGRFKVRDFQFFLSNIKLTGANGVYVEPDSYHLVRFDGGEPGFVIVLRGVPRRNYGRVEFGIGVDAAANGSLVSRGDLDPNSRMAWSWEVGYKFVLFEGALLRGDTNTPLVYHVGFTENYRPVAIELRDRPLEDRHARLDFRVDVLQLFKGSTNIDMAALPSVKFDHADAALLGRNFGAMITPVWADEAGRDEVHRPASGR